MRIRLDCYGVLLFGTLTTALGCQHGQFRRPAASARVPAMLVSDVQPNTVQLAAHSLPEDSHRRDAHRAEIAIEQVQVESQHQMQNAGPPVIRATEVNYLDQDQQLGQSANAAASTVASQSDNAQPKSDKSTTTGSASRVSLDSLAQSFAEGMTLEQLISTALGSNPAIRQAEAAVSKALGFRYQVSLRPNPWMGYNGTQLADRGTDQHTVVVQQSLVTAQKLQRNTNVLNYEVENLKWQAEQQRRAVTNDVKQSFYELLGAQHQLELSKQFVAMAEKAVEVVRQRKQAGEGTEVDVLQSEVQLQQVTIANRQALASLVGARSRLAATINQPNTVELMVNGQLPTEPRTYQWDAEYTRICNESPELMAAQTRVARARANLDRQRVQAHPNIDWMLGAGFDNGTDSQMINTQVGIPLPVNNQNQGNQSAAYAEYCRAMHEVQRIQLSLKARLATASQAYESAAASVSLYRTAVVPKAEKMLELAEITFKAGEIDFLQVLTIRRTYFDSMFELVSSQTQLAQAGASIDELLLSGSLDNSVDSSLDDGLRDQALGGQ